MTPENKPMPESDNLEGHAVGISDLLAYQEGAVVSRTIMKKETGTVTLFAFDRDEGLSEHTAPFDAMVLCLDGEAEIVIAQNKVRVSKGDVIIMPANKPHALKALERFMMLLVMLRS